MTTDIRRLPTTTVKLSVCEEGLMALLITIPW